MPLVLYFYKHCALFTKKYQNEKFVIKMFIIRGIPTQPVPLAFKAEPEIRWEILTLLIKMNLIQHRWNSISENVLFKSI